MRYGVSPRGAQAIVLGSKIRALIEDGLNVSIEDVRTIALPALRHRLILNFEAEAGGTTADDVLRAVDRRGAGNGSLSGVLGILDSAWGPW